MDVQPNKANVRYKETDCTVALQKKKRVTLHSGKLKSAAKLEYCFGHQGGSNL